MTDERHGWPDEAAIMAVVARRHGRGDAGPVRPEAASDLVAAVDASPVVRAADYDKINASLYEAEADCMSLRGEVERLGAAVEAHRASWVNANGASNLEGNARPDDLELWAALRMPDNED